MLFPRFRHFLLFVWSAGIVAPVFGANQVALTASAKDDYVRSRIDGETLRPESYVFMQGKYFSGTTKDSSIEKLPFRRIAEYLVPELAKQEFFPAKELAKSDLLLVVHWGTTVPRMANGELRARDGMSAELSENADVLRHSNLTEQAADLAANPSPDEAAIRMMASHNPEADIAAADQLEQIADQTQADYSAASNGRLLGYSKILSRLGKNIVTNTTEETLRFDMTTERYFLVVMAYDLREKIMAGKTRRPVWTLHVNIRSPGNNFETALSKMSHSSASYFGQNTDEVKTIQPRDRGGKVIIPPFKIMGEVK